MDRQFFYLQRVTNESCLKENLYIIYMLIIAFTVYFVQLVPSMVKKTIQLYETMIVRHGVMTVGPTGGGKTTSYEVRESSTPSLPKRSQIS